jgi:hypothetical protein
MATFDPFDYASSATGSDTPARPSDSEIATGLQAGQTLTSALWNWALAYIGRLSRGAQAFSTLEDAVDELAAGESGIVHEDDGGTAQPGGIKSQIKPFVLSTEPSQHNVVAIDTDGRNVAFATARPGSTPKVYLYARGDLTLGGTALLALTPSTTDSVGAVLYDGTYLVAAYGAVIRCYDASDGSVLWTYTHAGPVFDLAMDGTHVYFAGQDASSIAAGAIALTDSGTASAVWTYNHGADLNAVCTDGSRVFVGGAIGTGNVTLRSLAAATGATTGPGTWALGTAGNPVAQGLRTDGKILIQGNSMADGVATLEVRGCDRGQVIASRQHLTLDAASAIDPTSVALDDQYVYVSQSNASSSNTGGVNVYRRDLTPALAAAAFDDGAGGTGNTIGAIQVVSDGQSMFAAHNIGSATSTDGKVILTRFYRPGAGRRFLRVAATADYLPARQRIIPEGW